MIQMKLFRFQDVSGFLFTASVTLTSKTNTMQLVRKIFLQII